MEFDFHFVETSEEVLKKGPVSWEAAVEVKVLNPIKETRPKKGRDVETTLIKIIHILYLSFLCGFIRE